jgi:two-component system, cell cycle sensor histidine kinase and response regulator CckA
VFNRIATELLGYSSEELLGRKYLDLIRPDYRPIAQRFYRQQLASRTPHSYLEFPALSRDGREIWFGQNVELIHENGRPVGFQAVTRDITLQRRAQEEQGRAREELERRVRERTEEVERASALLRCEMEERRQAEEHRRKLEAQVQHTQRLESLGLLAGGIAHDFNNLLTAIMGYAALALSEMPADSRAFASIEEVISASKAAAGLTQQMLAYSGRGKFIIEPLNVSQVTEDVSRLIGTLISKKSVLNLHLAADLPAVNGDSAQLRQVLVNLIVNASEALGERSGEIRVTTGTVNSGEGELKSSEPGHVMPAGTYVFIEVLDTGSGMDAATQARIFDPFFSTKFTGRGLGLAAVLGIVRGHRGTVEIVSQLGRGTRFRVLLPAAEETIHMPTRSARVTPAEWRGEGTVLVVDDEPPVRDLARQIIEHAGLTVLLATDGNEAVRRFDEHAREIRAVLLDLTMPGMDGGEVFQHLIQIRPDVKVVI